MRLQRVSSINPFTLSISGNFKPAARMFAPINNNISIIGFVILEDAQASLLGYVNKRKFIVLSEHCKFLRNIACKRFEGDFGCDLVYGKSFGFLKN